MRRNQKIIIYNENNTRKYVFMLYVHPSNTLNSMTVKDFNNLQSLLSANGNISNSEVWTNCGKVYDLTNRIGYHTIETQTPMTDLWRFKNLL